jgi:hypothetical protein
MNAKQMTLKKAMAIAVSETYAQSEWLAAERVFAAHKICPHCACGGEQIKLGRLQDSTQDTYAGRECPMCEEFVPDLGQDHHFDGWDRSVYDTDASGMCFSDADSGL